MDDRVDENNSDDGDTRKVSDLNKVEKQDTTINVKTEPEEEETIKVG